MTITFLAAAKAAPAVAPKSEWVWLGENPDGDVGHVDKNSIRMEPSGYMRAWVRSDYGKVGPHGARAHEAYEEFDCQNRRKRPLQIIFFLSNEAKKYDRPLGWSVVTPNTIGEDVLEFVCFGKLD